MRSIGRPPQTLRRPYKRGHRGRALDQTPRRQPVKYLTLIPHDGRAVQLGRPWYVSLCPCSRPLLAHSLCVRLGWATLRRVQISSALPTCKACSPTFSEPPRSTPRSASNSFRSFSSSSLAVSPPLTPCVGQLTYGVPVLILWRSCPVLAAYPEYKINRIDVPKRVNVAGDQPYDQVRCTSSCRQLRSVLKVLRARLWQKEASQEEAGQEEAGQEKGVIPPNQKGSDKKDDEDGGGDKENFDSKAPTNLAVAPSHTFLALLAPALPPSASHPLLFPSTLAPSPVAVFSPHLPYLVLRVSSSLAEPSAGHLQRLSRRGGRVLPNCALLLGGTGR